MQRLTFISLAFMFEALVLAAPARAQSAPSYEPSPAARRLAEDGVALFKDGRYQEAVALLQQAQTQYQAPQYLLYMGRAYAKLGKLVEACDKLEAAAAMTAPDGAPPAFLEKFEKAKALAKEDLVAIEKRIPVVKLTVSGPILREVRVTDGAGSVRTAIEDNTLRVETNTGERTLRVEAEGFSPAELRVNAAERSDKTPIQTLAVALVQIATVAPGPSVATPAPPNPVPASSLAGAALKPGRPREAPPSPQTLSHRGQFGTYARGDFQVTHAGVAVITGISFGAHDFIEPYAGAILGRNVGLEPGVAVYFLRGALKPKLDVAVPILFEDKAYAGVRAAAGVQWDPVRNFGVFLQAGGAFFPEIRRGYYNFVFLPTFGIQGRL